MTSLYFRSERELTRVLILCFIATICYGATTSKSNGTEDAQCSRYNDAKVRWTCRRIANCQYSSNILQTIHEHRCGLVESMQKICCPERVRIPVASSKRPPKPISSPRKDYAQIIRRKCDEYAKARYVEKCYGGQVFGQEAECRLEMDCKGYDDYLGPNDAFPKEFPHAALIGEGDDVNDVVWRCAGSLISERFILSAAHCTPMKNRLFKWAAVGIQYRSEAVPEELNKKIFQIVKAYTYPGAKTSRYDYDIILYELKNSVKFTQRARPICLHTEFSTLKENDTKAIAIGWGINETSSDQNFDTRLQKMSMNFLPNDLCAQKYSNYDGKSMVCAGNLRLKDDTCRVDSGASLQILHKLECMYEHVGIASRGYEHCGSGTPGIYTRVSAYLEWIVNIVWPNEV